MTNAGEGFGSTSQQEGGGSFVELTGACTIAPAIAELKKAAGDALSHPLLPRAARESVMRLVRIVEAQNVIIGKLQQHVGVHDAFDGDIELLNRDL